MLSGELARLARMLEGLRGRSEAPPRVLWLLAEEIRAICRVQDGLAKGRSLAEVCREARVGGCAADARGPRREEAPACRAALRTRARGERWTASSRVWSKANAWDELLQLGLRFAA